MATSSLTDRGFYDKAAWRKPLAKTSAGDPLLVQRLDCADSFYYLVPMEVRKKVTRAFVSIDARYGIFRQAIAFPQGCHDLIWNPNEALERVVGKQFDLPRHQGRVKVRKEAYSLYPTLVWKPCRESMTPYLPFFMINVGNRQLYVRVDGQVFTKLHTKDRGI